MSEKRFLSIFEDLKVTFYVGELPPELLPAADDGLYSLVDITNPDSPLEYWEGTWSEVGD